MKDKRSPNWPVGSLRLVQQRVKVHKDCRADEQVVVDRSKSKHVQEGHDENGERRRLEEENNGLTSENSGNPETTPTEETPKPSPNENPQTESPTSEN